MSTASAISVDQLPAALADQIRFLETLASDPQLQQVVTQHALSGAKRHFMEGKGPDGQAWPPLAHSRVRGGSKPLRDTGGLMASIQAGVRADGDRLVIVVSSNKVQAALMQHGGQVAPKKGKFLAIPLTKEALRAGSPRSFQGTLHFVGKRNSGKGALIDARGRAQYALTNRVLIPARPFLGFSDATIDRIGNAVVARLKSHLRQG